MSDKLSQSRKMQLISEYSIGFIASVGFIAEDMHSGSLTARLKVRDEHRQQDGFVHAGVMATMADHTAGYAAYTMIPEDHRILTVEFKINYLRPAKGEELVCRSRVIKPGRRILVCESEVYDRRGEDEVLAAKAQLTMASVAEAEL